MKSKKSALTKTILAASERSLAKQYMPQILECLAQLSDEEIWWRPNAASNSVGNMVLHLSGNIRQWIVSGLGGSPDTRERDREFSEQGPVPRKELVALFRKTVRETCRILRRLSDESLARKYEIQGYRVTGLETVYHVGEHFAYHAGQIIFVTKQKRGTDLGFTRLPAVKQKKRAT